MLVLHHTVPGIINEITFVFQKNLQQSLVYAFFLALFCWTASEVVCFEFLLPLNYVFKYLKQVKWHAKSEIPDDKNGQVNWRALNTKRMQYDGLIMSDENCDRQKQHWVEHGLDGYILDHVVLFRMPHFMANHCQDKFLTR